MTTKSKTNIIKLLMDARAAIQPIKKSGTNPHFRSKYATLEGVIEAVTEPLAKHGFLLIHRSIQNLPAEDDDGNQASRGAAPNPTNSGDAPRPKTVASNNTNW